MGRQGHAGGQRGNAGYHLQGHQRSAAGATGSGAIHPVRPMGHRGRREDRQQSRCVPKGAGNGERPKPVHGKHGAGVQHQIADPGGHRDHAEKHQDGAENRDRRCVPPGEKTVQSLHDRLSKQHPKEYAGADAACGELGNAGKPGRGEAGERYGHGAAVHPKGA